MKKKWDEPIQCGSHLPWRQTVMLEHSCYSLSQNSFFSVLKIFVTLDIICLFSSLPRIKCNLFTLWRQKRCIPLWPYLPLLFAIYWCETYFFTYLDYPAGLFQFHIYLLPSCFMLYSSDQATLTPLPSPFPWTSRHSSFQVHTPLCPYIALAHTDWLSQVSYLCLNSSCQEKYWQLTGNLLIFIW